MSTEHFDVVVVGAGISGVGAGYFLKKNCPNKSFVILENRADMGGTWDLFRYPGIRSDSDMFTLGYSFKPWTEEKAIADGPSIWKYVHETAAENGIDKHIRFKHRVVSANWSSADQLWTVEVEHDGVLKRFTCTFFHVCAGYYNYEEGFLPAWQGTEAFKGRIIHPQHWPEDLDYAGKRVVVIGSGATAVTLVPSMADKAAHVTMLQRTPTYMVSMPAEDTLANWGRKNLPRQLAYDMTRFRKIIFQQIFFRLARNRPAKTRERLLGLIREQLGPDYDMETHFTPPYNPWEQRLCLVPDNDMFLAIKSGKASIETDHIERFTEKGLKLKSGKELEADIIITATGLNLRMLGGAEISVDGRKVDVGKSYTYKGAMLSDAPNMAFVFGYTNASWTLRADLINEYVCRLINYLDMYGLGSATPRVAEGPHEDKPFADFSSGYFARAEHLLPKQMTKAPWKQNQSYVHDMMDLRFGQIEDGVLKFSRRNAPAAMAPVTRQAVAAE
ncbi:MAG: NAD(P)/FAD-dependent oxidoreductase [Hyphomonadaceae bacterium]|nr:NAD(P)/FAD-dependent oxidoreductase [Hyphomonadaceae bacterium]